MKLRNQVINWRGNNATDTWNRKVAYNATVMSVKETDERTTGKWLNTDAMLYEVEFDSADGAWRQI